MHIEIYALSGVKDAEDCEMPAQPLTWCQIASAGGGDKEWFVGIHKGPRTVGTVGEHENDADGASSSSHVTVTILSRRDSAPAETRPQPLVRKTSYHITDPICAGATLWISVRNTRLWVVEPPAQVTVTMDDLMQTLVTAGRVFTMLCSHDSKQARGSRQSRVSRTCLLMITGVMRAVDALADGTAAAVAATGGVGMTGAYGPYCPCLLRLLNTLVWDLLRLRCAEDGMLSVSLARVPPVATVAAAVAAGLAATKDELCVSGVQPLRHVQEPWISVARALEHLAVRCLTALMVLRHMRTTSRRPAKFLDANRTLAGFLLALTLEERRCADPWAGSLTPSTQVSLSGCSKTCNVCACLSEVEDVENEVQTEMRLVGM